MIDTSRNVLYHLGNLNAENARITYQTATGDILKNGSDNSLLHADVIGIEDKIRITENLEIQIVKTTALNNVADSSMAEMKKLLDAIQTDLLKGLNDGMDRSDKLALATNISGMRENIYDLMNVRVDGEYVFSGSVSTERTMIKDPNFEDNGKVTFGGDGFLRKIAVQPGSYRDRGVTGYEVGFYNFNTYDGIDRKTDKSQWDGVGISGEQVVYQAGDRIIDQDGYEWKASADNRTLQKYDHNGVVFHPPIEIDLYMTPETQMRVDLGTGTPFVAAGGELYELEIDGNTYSYTAAAGDDETAIFTALEAQITADGYTVDAALHEGDKFYVSSATEMTWNTPAGTSLTTSNEIEATANSQSRQATYVFTVPSTPENLKFEAKHNYFDDLNIIINALEGYTTQLDGTKGAQLDEAGVDATLRTGLDQTQGQFDATNIGHGELGGRNKVFELSYEKIQAQLTHYNILYQETAKADLTKLAVESKSLEMTYSSLYSTISRMNELSLVNYL